MHYGYQDYRSAHLPEESSADLPVLLQWQPSAVLHRTTVLDKIFVPFFTTKTSGSGIGLSLCKQIMALHDGSINVKSELGKGSCFVLTFPK